MVGVGESADGVAGGMIVGRHRSWWDCILLIKDGCERTVGVVSVVGLGFVVNGGSGI